MKAGGDILAIYNYNGIKVVEDVITDKTLSLEDMPADAKAVGGALANAGIAVIEPTNDDIPLVFIDGTLPTSKDDGNVPVIINYISKTAKFKCYATLKVQGSSSVAYPKKNFTVKLYSDSERTTKYKQNFRGWGKQNKFVLKANWIDITHARNIVSARLWGDMVKSRIDLDQYPTPFKSAPNYGAVDGFVVKMFVNGVYHGRYTWNIPKDKWTFNMEVADTSAILCAGDINATAFFDGPATIDGGDNWEDVLHDDIGLPSMMTRFNAFISFVINSSDSDFISNLPQYAYVSSLLDYYIMLYVFNAADNIGKNQIYLTYEGAPFIASAYDMDSIYGLSFNGTLNVSGESKTSPFPDSEWGHKNLLYARLQSLFLSDIKARYAQLRNNALSTSNIIGHYEEFMMPQSNELIAEDYATTTAGGAFADIPSKTTNTIQYIRDFIAGRMAYVDSILLT